MKQLLHSRKRFFTREEVSSLEKTLLHSIKRFFTRKNSSSLDKTLLHSIVSSKCSFKIVEELLGAGAKDCFGNPVSAAVDAGCGNVSVVLLSRGASGEGLGQGKFRNVIREGILSVLTERRLEVILDGEPGLGLGRGLIARRSHGSTVGGKRVVGCCIV